MQEYVIDSIGNVRLILDDSKDNSPFSFTLEIETDVKLVTEKET
jgi:hypothetical protein